SNGRVFGPGVQASIQRLDHWQAQGIEALFRIQAGDGDAETMLAGVFFEMHVHTASCKYRYPLGSGAQGCKKRYPSLRVCNPVRTNPPSICCATEVRAFPERR